MLSLNTYKRFYRKTKRGSVIMIVREHYLRNDIPCGLDKCTACSSFMNGSKSGNKRHKDSLSTDVLNGFEPQIVNLCSSNPRSGLCKSLKAHIIVPDASIFLKQFNILEDSLFGNDVVCLQTVLTQVRADSLSAYSRVKQLQANDGAVRRFSVFNNDFHIKTYRERKPGEGVNEYSNRLTRVVVKWLQEHWKDEDFELILVTCDPALKESSTQDKIKCLLIKEYLEDFNDSTELLDKLASTDFDSKKPENNQPGTGSFLYPEHLNLSAIQSGIKSGKYYQGKFTCNRDNRQEGHVTVSIQDASDQEGSSEVNVLVQGLESINRAVHEDIVAIELLPKSEWRTSLDMVEEEDITTEEEVKDKSEASYADLKQSLEDDYKKRPTGKVVGIIRRAWRPYCGIIRQHNMSENLILSFYSFIPFDKRIPVIRIETRQYERLKGNKIVVQIDAWPRDSKLPKGHYVKSLGVAGDKETENEVLLLEHDVPHDDFSPAILASLPPDDYVIPPQEAENRKDLRHLTICSVDPPGCTDIDDALHARLLGPADEGYQAEREVLEVGVHIADVSHYVKPGSPIDMEASRRGTTVYLVDRRIDMIPGRLSSDLCSLREGVERLTFSVIWRLDRATGDILDTTFYKSIIKSSAALTYAEAQMRIDSPADQSPTAKSLRLLNELSKKLKAKRLAAGALVLASAAEIKFIESDSETADNTMQIEAKQMRDTNYMVEEFMLLANIAVARKIYETLPELALLRRHPKPAPENFSELIEAAQRIGFEIDVNSGRGLSDTLAASQLPGDELVNLMLRMICTRCMTQARYFCSGALTIGMNEGQADKMETDQDAQSGEEKMGGGNFAHFGLATPIYTHFTSPIRRYADLLVHRMLAHTIGHTALAANMLNKRQLASVTDNLNYRHRMAQYAGRASVGLSTVRFIKRSPGGCVRDEPARIMKIAKNALKIFIPRLALEVNYFTHTTDGWVHDDQAGVQRKESAGVVLKQFDPVQVHLSVAGQDTNRESIVTKITSPPIDRID